MSLRATRILSGLVVLAGLALMVALATR